MVSRVSYNRFYSRHYIEYWLALSGLCETQLAFLLYVYKITQIFVIKREILVDWSDYITKDEITKF